MLLICGVPAGFVALAAPCVVVGVGVVLRAKSSRVAGWCDRVEEWFDAWQSRTDAAEGVR